MESAKECVTTHLPKQLALKMVWRLSILPILDRRGTKGLTLFIWSDLEAPVSRRVAVVSVEGYGVGRPGAATGADLGGSSKESRETLLEGRSGEGFHVNISWT